MIGSKDRLSFRILLFIAIIADSYLKAVSAGAGAFVDLAYNRRYNHDGRYNHDSPKIYHDADGSTSYQALRLVGPDDGDIVDDGNDWLEAELTLRNFPKEPLPHLEPEHVLNSCLRSLQFIDHPAPSSGLARCFPFFTWECRKVVTARMGGDTVERFIKYGQLAPALQPFYGATRIDIGDATYTQSTSPTRGDLISFPVTVHGSMVLSFQHSSGMIKDGISSTPPVTTFVVRLEKNRRPPDQHCWLIREVLDIRYAFQGDMGNAHVGG